MMETKSVNKDNIFISTLNDINKKLDLIENRIDYNSLVEEELFDEIGYLKERFSFLENEYNNNYLKELQKEEIDSESEDYSVKDDLTARRIADYIYDRYNLSSCLVKGGKGLALIVPINEKFSMIEFVKNYLTDYLNLKNEKDS